MHLPLTSLCTLPVVQPRGFRTRWRSPLKPYAFGSPEKHSRYFQIRLGIATAGAAVQPNLPLQKLQLTLRCSNRHPAVGRSAKDTAGTLHVEGPACSIGSSTGYRAQEE